MPPYRKIRGILFYCCPSVCLHKLNIYPITPSLVTRLVFGMKAHLINTHLLIPRSRSSAKVKVKYQGHDSKKMGVSGGISVSQTHIVFLMPD